MQDLEERPTSPNRLVILSISPERASKPKRAAIQGQEDISQEELGRVIAERQGELWQLMEREASGKSAPEEKGKFY